VLEVVPPPKAVDRVRIKRTMLRGHPLLRGCSNRVVRRVAAVADTIEVPAGEVLVQQGRQGMWFFLVEEGRAEAVRDDGPVGEVGPGQWFGEAAVLRHVPQPATVRAVTAMKLFVIGCQRLVPLVRDTRALRRELGDVAPGPHLVGPLELATRARAERTHHVRAFEARPQRRRARRQRWLAAGLLAAFAIACAAVYHPPVDVVAQGPVFDAARDITITGVPTSPVHGRYLVATVRTTRPSLLGLGLALAEPHHEAMIHKGAPRGVAESRVQAQGRAVFERSRYVAAAAAATAAGLSLGRAPDGSVVLPFTIRFRPRAVAGPSAGLAYALAIEDMLRAADLARGRTVAATGELGADGSVRAVGYVAEKAASVRARRATVLFVPDGQVTGDALEHLSVWSVTSLPEALGDLRR
jgi:CRP-like cAMP-binding protein